MKLCPNCGRPLDIKQTEQPAWKDTPRYIVLGANCPCKLNVYVTDVTLREALKTFSDILKSFRRSDETNA